MTDETIDPLYESEAEYWAAYWKHLEKGNATQHKRPKRRAPGFYWVTILKGSRPTIAQWTGWHWFPHGGSVQMSDYSLHEIGPRISDSPEEMKEFAAKIWDEAVKSTATASGSDFDTFYKQLIDGK